MRKKLRKKFTSAEIGVTGANFLVADAGGIILTENEGNGLMSVAFPKVHIVISGIEKIIAFGKRFAVVFTIAFSIGYRTTGNRL